MYVWMRKTITPEQKRESHRRRTRKAQRKRRARAARLGLCNQCQAQLENASSPTCAECRRKSDIRSKALMESRISEGICPICRNPFDQLHRVNRYIKWYRGESACFFCVNRPKIMVRRGMCVKCMRRRRVEGRDRCDMCLADARIRDADRRRRRAKVMSARMRSVRRSSRRAP